MKVGPVERAIIVEEPFAASLAPLPVALVFHGGGGSAALMQDRSRRLSEVLRQNGFLVVYMNGSSRFGGKNLRTWNAVHCCAYAADNHIDEAAFVSAALTALETYVDIDESRIMLIGHSNGAMLSYQLAAGMEPAPHAIVAISGALFADQPDLPEETSVLAIHTLDDDVVDFDGSGGKSKRWRDAPNLSFEAAHQHLLDDKACGATGVTIPAPGVVQSLADCEAGSRVMTIESQTGGHEWPKTIPSYDLEAAIAAFLSD